MTTDSPPYIAARQSCFPKNRAPRLIGIVGRKEHGKTTLANMLLLDAEEHGVSYIIDALAAPIKQACEEWFGMSHAHLHGHLKEVQREDIGKTPREIMQILGTEVGRQIHEDVWINAALRRAQRRSEGTILADVRFPNEFNAIRQAGGLLIYVNRPGIPNNAHSDHDSERHIEALGAHADIKVLNGGGIGDLEARVHEALRPFFPSEFRRSWMDLQRAMHDNSVNHGFWEDVDVLFEMAGDLDEEKREAFRAMVHAQKLQLIGDEISEAHEAIRSGNPASVKAEGFSAVEEELADVIIRIMDYAAYFGLDIPGAMEAKSAYNKGRPYKHGRIS